MEEELCGYERGVAAHNCPVEFPPETADIRAQPHLSNCTGKCFSMKQIVRYCLPPTVSPKILFSLPDAKQQVHHLWSAPAKLRRLCR